MKVVPAIKYITLFLTIQYIKHSQDFKSTNQTTFGARFHFYLCNLYIEKSLRKLVKLHIVKTGIIVAE